MSGARRWRPLVVRTAGSVTEAIYGLILATSVIAVSREYDSSNAGVVAVTVLVTGIVFWLAHVYARVLATSIAQHRRLSRVRDARGAPPRLATGRGHHSAGADPRARRARHRARQGVDPRGDARRPGGAGLRRGYAARLRGSGLGGAVVSAAIAVALGSAVVLLKAFVH